MKKKILFMVLNGEEYGGSEKNVQDIINNLDSDFMITLIYSQGNPIINKINRIENFNSYPIKRNIFSLVDIIRILSFEKPNVVHFHAARAIFMGRLVSNILNLFRKNKFIIITTIHGLYLPKEKDNFIIKYLLRIFSKEDTRTICVSREDKKILINQFNYKNKIEVIYNGVDVEHYIPKIKKIFNSKIGFVGRLSKQKNPMILLDVAKKLKPEFELFFYGDGPLMNDLVDKCEQEKINNVFFKGFLNDVSEAYDEISILISLSVFEGLPYSYIESISSGIPVIATDVGGVPEVIQSGSNGVLLKPSLEICDVIEAINCIAKDYETYSQNCIKSASEFSIAKMIKKYQNLYDEVIGEDK